MNLALAVDPAGVVTTGLSGILDNLGTIAPVAIGIAAFSLAVRYVWSFGSRLAKP
jgi:hypothetical protein